MMDVPTSHLKVLYIGLLLQYGLSYHDGLRKALGHLRFWCERKGIRVVREKVQLDPEDAIIHADFSRWSRQEKARVVHEEQ
ncbi:hypothetical protein JCM8547_002741 [Rhodosporidiobolus lusitaniae]